MIMNHNKNIIKRQYQTIILFYSVLFILLLCKVTTCFYQFPLFPIQYESLEWNSAWLVTTALEYHGAALVLGGIVLSSESSWWKGIAWNIGFNLVGSPICCLWIILWIYNGGTLSLSSSSRRTTMRE